MIDGDSFDIAKLFAVTNLHRFIDLNNPLVLIMCSGLYVLFNLDYQKYKKYFNLFTLYSLFYKSNSVHLSGTQTTVTAEYSSSSVISGNYSDEFIAMIKYILEHCKDVHKLRYLFVNILQKKTYYDNEFTNNGLYVVDQDNYFLIDKEKQMYGNTVVINAERDGSKQNRECTTVELTIVSFKLSVNELKEFIDDIRIKLKSEIESKKKDKLFNYKLVKNDDDSKYNCWNERSFITVKTFDNIFFPNKKEILESIDFFLNNKKWYFEYGIPYTLGFLLHGVPGTGKTSFIKALAKYTKRHIVCISFKYIKTANDLEKFFYEQTYDRNNDSNSIGFKDKIYVFEDIDCADDIISRRPLSELKYEYKKHIDKNEFQQNSDEEIANGKSVKEIVTEMKNQEGKAIETALLKEPKLTLDDILNILDGIDEHPGRILIMTTNHVEKLDDALIRPGRIDKNIKFDYVTPNTVKEMYYHFTKTHIVLSKNKCFKKTPAQITNYILSCKNKDKYNKSEFLRLLYS